MSNTIRQVFKDRVFLTCAMLLSKLSTCSRRDVGCVLTDKRNRILATGYNGVAAGADHCKGNPCKGSKLPSGSGLDLCEAIHAEQNALTFCNNIDNIYTVYTTTSPCMHCAKMLANTGAQRIVYHKAYGNIDEITKYWNSLGREIKQSRYINLIDLLKVIIKD